jgi:hypothetical protein
MKPFAIILRFTAAKKLRYYGYDESNVVLISQSNAFMTREPFQLSAEMMFFPTIDEHNRDLGDQRKALHLLDGIGSHHIEQFLAECTAPNIEILFLIVHASDQLQPLDFLTFAMMKETFSASKLNSVVNHRSNKVVRILGA